MEIIMEKGILGMVAFCLMAVAMLSPAVSAMAEIDHVTISPTYPDAWDDMTCNAHVSEIHGSLESIRFTWFRNGVGVREYTRTIHGSYASETDTLDSFFTREGDEISCRVDVWDECDNKDTEIVSVHVREASQNNPPVIEGIPDQMGETGEIIEINLWDYASDAEDSDSELEFTIDVQPNHDIVECHIYNDRYLNCGPARQLGQTAVTLRVTDTRGAWDTDTFVICIRGDCPSCSNEPPEIGSIDIEPNHPDEDDDIECEVTVEDNDGNLEKVEFRWYVDGDLERTRTRDVSGHSDTVSDILYSGKTSEGDEVKCRATVEDTDGETETRSAYVEVEDDDFCRIDIYDLEVEDQEDIRFRIRNRGDQDTEVEYRIYVNGDRVEEDDVYIDEGESERISFEYDDFDEDEDYEIRVWARADCGDTDEEEVEYDILGDCSIHIFNLRVRNGEQISFDIVNGGNDDEYVEYRIYINGFRVEEDDIEVDEGDTETIYYIYDDFSEGQEYEIRAYVHAECGRSDSRRVFYRPFVDDGDQDGGDSDGGDSGQAVCNYNLICEAGESWGTCPYDCPAPEPEPAPTSVKITPTDIDVNRYKSKVVTIEIESRISQDFSIAVLGVPQEWLDYDREVHADGKSFAYVFVNPRELGEHQFVVRVAAQEEGLEFAEGINLFVARQDDAPAQGDGITGAIWGVFSNIYAIIILIIIASIVLLYVAVNYLGPEEEITFRYR